MLLYPKAYFEKITEIDISFLNKNNIKAIILDVDNTILDLDRNMPEEIKKWCENLKKQSIKFCIVSNTNKKDKVEYAAGLIDVPYFYFARKPGKSGLKKAVKLLDEKSENIAAIGDQIFTDVVGSNRCKMYSILTKPLEKRDILITKIKRPLESLVVKRYLRNRNKEG